MSNETPAGKRLFREISDETKDDLFDETNQIFHDAAFAWQLIEQNDPEEAVDTLTNIKGRVEEMLANMERFRITDHH